VLAHCKSDSKIVRVKEHLDINLIHELVSKTKVKIKKKLKTAKKQVLNI
jgi:hypothetical protein